MITRLIVKNYMAHRHTVLELSPGVTVITGPNNSGKSALVEAVRSIAQNPSTKHAVRHGAKKAIVRMELDSGEAIEWIRGEGGAVYELTRPAPPGGGGEEEAEGTETYAKFGRKPPEDVRSLLRLDPVQTETGSVDIHIGNQRYPIFLLDQAGSQAASFFAASTEAEHLLRMQQRLKEKSDFAARRRRELLRRCSEQEKELERFEGLETVEEILRRVEQLFEHIGRSRHVMPLLTGSVEGLVHVSERLDQASTRCWILTALVEPPEILETPALESWIEKVAALRRLAAIQAVRADVLAAASDPPSLADAQGLEEVMRRMESATGAMAKAEGCATVLAALPSLPEPYDTAVIENLMRDLEGATALGGRLRSAGELLKGIDPPPEPTDGASLRDLAADLEAAAARRDHSRRREGAMSTLAEPPHLLDTPPLNEAIQSIHALEARIGRVYGRLNRLQALSMPPDPQSATDLENTLREIIRFEEAIQRSTALQDKQSSELHNRRETLRRTLKDIGACPLCGHNMDLDHFLVDSHEGGRGGH